ncbi:MAG: hypothetical protein JW940_32585 [Polyangiaceae bacterium]|nr:hypothetical protein [Polyangiaceae bacterium]
MSSRDELLGEISREESRLADLQAQVEAATARLIGLREQLVSVPAVQTRLAPDVVKAPAVTPATNVAKVALFRSLFRGRDDVFPRRWENEKKGKSGYCPACANEWEWGVCAKKMGSGSDRRATCGECSNQAFIPVSDEQVAKHLRGDQVMGVYPLLSDETCWFLAADFDKKTWQQDIAAFTETCDAHGVPVAVERLSSLISVRAELARGDLRALYIGWLLRAQAGELNDNDTEPPLPPGLGQLSASLGSLAEFLRIDADLLHVAAEAVPAWTTRGSTVSQARAWVGTLAAKEKDEIITNLVVDGDHVQISELLQRFLKERSAVGGARTATGRTAGELLRGAEAYGVERKRIEAEKRAKEQARLEREPPFGTKTWCHFWCRGAKIGSKKSPIP